MLVWCHSTLITKCYMYYARKKESEVAQSCPTLFDPMDCNLPCSSITGIFLARVLEWVAISFSSRYIRSAVEVREGGINFIWKGSRVSPLGKIFHCSNEERGRRYYTERTRWFLKEHSMILKKSSIMGKENWLLELNWKQLKPQLYLLAAGKWTKPLWCSFFIICKRDIVILTSQVTFID